MPKKLRRALQILIANGVNLDLLGQREPHIYGSQSLGDLERLLRAEVKNYAAALQMECPQLIFFQSNAEHVFLEELTKKWDGALINPGAWTHTSLALADRLGGLKLPFVEVHISNIYAREPIRQTSLTAPKAIGVVTGFGLQSYELGLRALLSHLNR